MNKPAKWCRILRLHLNVISRGTPLEESILMPCYAVLTGVMLTDVSEGTYVRYSGSSVGRWGQQSSSKYRQLCTDRHPRSPSAALAWEPRISQTYSPVIKYRVLVQFNVIILLWTLCKHQLEERRSITKVAIIYCTGLIGADETVRRAGAVTNYRGPAVRKGGWGPDYVACFCLSR